MFAISLPNYESSPKLGIAPFATTGETSNAPAWQWQQSPNLQMIALENPGMFERRVYASIPEGTETITTVLLNGETQTNWQFDDSGTGIIITPEGDIPPVLEVVILAVVPSPNIKTTEICDNHPAILSEINAEGTMSINRSLSTHPSASFSFYACKSDEDTVRDRLCNGTEINLFGVGYFTNNLTITRLKQNNLIKVAVSLAGKYASRGNPSVSALDEPIRLSGIDSARLKTEYGTSYRKTSLTAIAQKAGVNFTGLDFEWWLPKARSIAPTTFRSEFEQRAGNNCQFPYYSNPNTVEGRTWGQTNTHYLSSCDVISDETFTINGHMSLLDGVKLYKEYENTILKLDFNNIPEPEKKSQLVCRYEFENTASSEAAGSYAVETTQGFRASGNDILRNMSINFDQGGFTKTVKKIEEVNGVKRKETVQVWGTTVVSTDVYLPQSDGEEIAFSGGDAPSAYWGIVKEYEKTYHYDNDGYLIAETTRGWQKARFRQETEKLEAITARINRNATTDLEEQQEYQIIEDYYKFNQILPIREDVIYELESLRDYFSDIKRTLPFSDWIEPKFVARVSRASEEFRFEAAKAKDEDGIKRPVVVSKKSGSETRVIITDRGKPGRFVSQQYNQNAEGEYGKNAIRINNVTENIGRPGIQQRIETDTYTHIFQSQIKNTYRYRKIFLNSLPEDAQAIEEYYDNYANAKLHYDYTAGASIAYINLPAPIERETISFPGLYDYEQALAAARCKLSMDNTKGAEILALDTVWHSEYQEGDRLYYKNKLYIILGINANIIIDRGRLRCDKFSLNLGRYLEPPVFATARNFSE